MKATQKNRRAALARVAKQIESCRSCRRQATGKPVVGEGSSVATIVFVGEAPGRMESESGRPFVGRSGQWLRRTIRSIGLDERSVYLTSALKYRPARGKPSAAAIAHGRIHLLEQLEILDPKIVVLLGSTACLGVLNEKVAVRRRHGNAIERDGRVYLITVHPAGAARFPAIGKAARQDFQKLKALVAALSSRRPRRSR